ncbi:MAG: sulfatase-like hydrolase/transferase, partial [Planctomycetota bacterium]
IQGAKGEFGPEAFRKFILEFIDAKKNDRFLAYFPMALVHSPFIHPPRLRELSESRFPEDLDEKTRAFGHMVTYMDSVIGDILDRLKVHGIEEETLVIFTGDNGTHRQITSRIGDLEIKGGKGTMTETGARVPLIAWQPGTIEPGVCDELFALIDILPTINAWAGIETDHDVDGLDLSHLLRGEEGVNRDHVAIQYRQDYFVRDKRFRLNSDGNLYDVPVTSNERRYSELITEDPAHASDRRRLQERLDALMAIEQTFPKPRPAKKTNK